ncbi:MAG: hypothetical protein EBT86_12095 [Actinobacteria bacterium]|nr:hypothetical protein [Actinomycetota bacterium]
MGCDYYTQICTRIIYRDDSGNEVEFDIDGPKEPGYCSSTSDPDLVEPKDEVHERCTEYGEKVLFENQTWTCTDYGKEHIQYICKKNNISEASLVKVYKFMCGWWR